MIVCDFCRRNRGLRMIQLIVHRPVEVEQERIDICDRCLEKLLSMASRGEFAKTKALDAGTPTPGSPRTKMSEEPGIIGPVPPVAAEPVAAAAFASADRAAAGP